MTKTERIEQLERMVFDLLNQAEEHAGGTHRSLRRKAFRLHMAALIAQKENR